MTCPYADLYVVYQAARNSPPAQDGPPRQGTPAQRHKRKTGPGVLSLLCCVARSHAQLSSAYHELANELGTENISVVGNYTLGRVIGQGISLCVRLTPC